MPYRFGRFVLDGDTHQLLVDGVEAHLTPKAFELLTVLVANRSRAVSKAELLQRLWPSTFVEETNLAGLVAEIRRALQDPATRPAFLRTIYGYGYRFVGDVVETSAAAATAPRPRLVFQNRQFVLMEGVNIIGRSPDAAIQCEAAGVSRHHARILLSQGDAILEDLASKNGTYVQGKRITSAPLSDGDEIRLGKASLIFRTGPSPGETETVATEPASDKQV